MTKSNFTAVNVVLAGVLVTSAVSAAQTADYRVFKFGEVSAKGITDLQYSTVCIEASHTKKFMANFPYRKSKPDLIKFDTPEDTIMKFVRGHCVAAVLAAGFIVEIK